MILLFLINGLELVSNLCQITWFLKTGLCYIIMYRMFVSKHFKILFWIDFSNFTKKNFCLRENMFFLVTLLKADPFIINVYLLYYCFLQYSRFVIVHFKGNSLLFSKKIWCILNNLRNSDNLKAVLCVCVVCTPFWPAGTASLWCFERLVIVHMFGKQLFQLIQKDSFLSKTTCTEKFERPCFLGFQDSSELGFSRFGVWGVKKPGVESRRRGVTTSIGLLRNNKKVFSNYWAETSFSVTQCFQRSWRTLSAAPLHLHTELHSGFRSVLLGNYLWLLVELFSFAEKK